MTYSVFIESFNGEKTILKLNSFESAIVNINSLTRNINYKSAYITVDDRIFVVLKEIK